MERRSALRDDQWERLAALNLPGVEGHVGRTAQDNRLFVEAVLFRFRAGIAWRDLPARFGNWHRIYVIDSTVVRAHRNSAGARKKRAVTKRTPGPPPRPSRNASVEAGAD